MNFKCQISNIQCPMITDHLKLEIGSLDEVASFAYLTLRLKGVLCHY